MPVGSVERPKMVVDELELFYDTFHALKQIVMSIASCRVTAMIGPSGCGKSSLLRCLNRMNELIETARVTGRILLDGEDIMQPSLPLVSLRKRVGMVFNDLIPFRCRYLKISRLGFVFMSWRVGKLLLISWSRVSPQSGSGTI